MNLYFVKMIECLTFFNQATTEFMAIEVAFQTYLHLKIPKESLLERCNVSSDKSCSSSSYNEPKKRCGSFWATYIHDLESIWWIVVWILHRFQKPEEKRETSKKILKERHWEPSLDLGSLVSRFDFWLHDATFVDLIQEIPRPVRALKKFVVECRDALTAAYKAKEINMRANSQIYMSDRCTIHKEVLELLQTARLKNDVDFIVPINRKAMNIKASSESELGTSKTGGNKDLLKNYEQQQVFATVEIYHIHLIYIPRTQSKTTMEQMSIGEHGLILKDISMIVSKAVFEIESTMAKKTATPRCKYSTIYKEGMKRKSQDISTPRPVKRKKVVETEEYRRVTRSMTKVR